MKSKINLGCCLIALTLTALLCGCASDGKPAILPNEDKNLNKTSAEFAADAAKRNYEADAPQGGAATARAEYELMDRYFNIINLSDTNWTDVEVWVNHAYVVFLPQMQKNVDKRLDFGMFFDRQGHHFDTNGGKNPITSLEVYRDGKMYTVKATQD
jgi:hypothetical protein